MVGNVVKILARGAFALRIRASQHETRVAACDGRVGAAVRIVTLAIAALVGLSGAAANAAPPPALTAQDLQTYRAAFRAAHQDHWSEALALASKASDKTLAKVLQWEALVRPGSDPSFDEIATFITNNPDWPSQNALRQRAEDAITDATPPTRVRSWFETHPPLSTTGKIRDAEALLALGQREKGLELLRQTWIEGNFGERQELIFLFKHHQDLRPQDNVARLDRLLWDGQIAAAHAMERRVDAGHAALAEARIKLMGMTPGVEWALRRVPASLAADPGLLFDRLRWRRRKGMDEEARAILMHPPANLVRPELWWEERAIEVHRALAQGYITEALRLAEHHDQNLGTASYADAEWLSGWIALRLLREPERALKHFRNMAEVVRYPISRSRAQYWEARALAAMGKTQEAHDAYAAAAQYGTTYYGQLSALRLDPASQPTLPPAPHVAVYMREAFNDKELVRAVHELGQIGERDLEEHFIKRLAVLAKTPEEAELVADLAVAEMRPDLAVRLARQTWHGEMPLTAHGYPVRPIPATVSAEGALVLSVIRQESAFDVKAVSRAGALGLMQLMPATARRTASELGVRFANDRLLDDPGYNIELGSAYLGHLLDAFGGNYVLALAAYNAGPANVHQWMHDNGDPRSVEVDPIDWIEMIPFSETRNYVQRVLEALQVYREQLAGSRSRALARAGFNLDRDLTGRNDGVVSKSDTLADKGESIGARLPR